MDDTTTTTTAPAPAPEPEPDPDPDASGRFVVLKERRLGLGDVAYVAIGEIAGKGQADAMRAFLADEPRLGELGVKEGDVLAAVPLRSWQPKPIRARGFVWG